jgi:hypothetical protein
MRTFRRTPGVIHDLLDDRPVLIDALGTELITLNHVGGLVWQSLDGTRDSTAVAAQVAERFQGVEPALITRDVELFLDELRRLGLVEETDSPAQRGEPAPQA